SETRYSDYFNSAMTQIKNDHVDPRTALETQENQALNNQQAAVARKSSTALVVSTVVPTPILNPGEISIRFGLGDFASPLPTQDLWDKLINDFTSSDPQVKQIVFETGFDFVNLKETSKQHDCFYVPFNLLSSQATSSLLSLDPFLAAD